jgi:PAS domain S-box-containing protein
MALSIVASRRATDLLWIMLIACVALPMALFGYVAWREHEGYLARGIETARQTTQILHEHALKVFEIQELAMDRLEARIAGLDWDEIRQRERELHDFADGIAAGHDEMIAMGLLDDKGRFVVTGEYPTKPADVGDRDYVQAMLAGYKGVYIGAPIVGRFTGKAQFTTARRRETGAQRFDGALLVSVDPAYFVDFWRTVMTADGAVSMFRDDGVVLATTVPAARAAPRMPADSPMLAHTKESPAGVFISPGRDGVDRLYAYEKLLNYPVYVSFGIATDVLYAPWRAQLVNYGLLALAMSLCLVAMTLSIMRYVRRQEEDAHRLAETGRRLAEEMSTRERAEREARRSQEDYRILYLKTPVMLHSIDRHGNIVNVSDFWLEQMGYDRHEVLGQKSSNFLTESSRKYNVEVGLPTLMQTGAVRQMPLQLVRKDGTVFDVLTNSLAERDEAGVFRRSLAVSLDVTEWKQAEAQLRQVQKMEAIGQLTGGIAHDLNNLLTVILANLERAEMVLDDPARLARAIAGAQRGADRAAALTSQLLSFSRRQPLEPRAVDVGRLLARLADLLRRTLGEAIEIETATPGGLWLAFCDAGQLESALVNLAVNARDAMRERGKLILEAENAALDRAYAQSHAEVKPGDYIMLAVSDTGCGMTPDIVERAFEPFFTTKPEGKGTGLGLSQVFGFASQSDGHVKIYSEPDRGTTVRLYLPRAPLDAVADTRPRSAASAPTGSETILVVEDDHDVRATVVGMLGDLGYTVIEAANPDEALRALEARKVALVFTDVVMPGSMTSRQMVEQALHLQPGIKVLFTSGYTHSVIVHDGRLDDGVHLISKPYRRDELARKLRSLLDT